MLMSYHCLAISFNIKLNLLFDRSMYICTLLLVLVGGAGAAAVGFWLLVSYWFLVS